MPTATRRLCVHVAIGPSGVEAQSKDRTANPITPPSASKVTSPGTRRIGMIVLPAVLLASMVAKCNRSAAMRKWAIGSYFFPEQAEARPQYRSAIEPHRIYLQRFRNLFVSVG